MFRVDLARGVGVRVDTAGWHTNTRAPRSEEFFFAAAPPSPPRRENKNRTPCSLYGVRLFFADGKTIWTKITQDGGLKKRTPYSLYEVGLQVKILK
jgi:hypothetical protein